MAQFVLLREEAQTRQRQRLQTAEQLPVDVEAPIQEFANNSAILQDQETERLTAELELDDLELIDACEHSAYGRKQAILDQLFDETVEQQKRFGDIVKEHYEQLRTFTDIPSDLERSWTYQVKPGDALLAQDKWNKLVVYENHIQELTTQAKLCFENETDSCLTGIAGYNNVLKNNRKLDILRKTWTSWQAIYNASDISD